MTATTQDRIDVIRIARQVWQGEIADVAGLAELQPFAPHMNDDLRVDLFDTLIAEIDRLHDLASTQAGSSQAERDDLIANAAHLVNTAADALIGEAS